MIWQVLPQKIEKSNRGGPLHEEIVLKPKLIVRQSCGERLKERLEISEKTNKKTW